MAEYADLYIKSALKKSFVLWAVEVSLYTLYKFGQIGCKHRSYKTFAVGSLEGGPIYYFFLPF